MPDSLRFGVVILAAGASTRLGSPKQLLAIGGLPLLPRTIEAALASGAETVVVVLGFDAGRIRTVVERYPVLIVENLFWAEGMASSIRAGVARIDQCSPPLDATALAVCDQPAFSADSLRRLAAALQATGRSIAAARYAGRNGAPAVFRRRHFPGLGRLTGDQGARALLNADPDQVASVDMPELELDIDTPDDFARAELS
ncbi:MAG TPA: nucleotidyltransferase family protein [Opitutaceae bacterium]|jgi:CTP:molybdopterin cytidylyltransferase MocA